MWTLPNVNADHGVYSEEVLDLSASGGSIESKGDSNNQDFVGTWCEVSTTVHAQPIT